MVSAKDFSLERNILLWNLLIVREFYNISIVSFVYEEDVPRIQIKAFFQKK